MAVAVTARQHMRELRERIKVDRDAALAELDEIFEDGEVPYPLLDGRYAGQVITTLFHQPFNSVAGFVADTWMPWRGKSFDIECGTGDNLLSLSGLWASRLLFPRYRGTISLDGDRCHAFGFRMSFGPSRINTDQDVLKVDYDLPENPSFLIRDLLDEIVEIGEGYYLGRSLLRRSSNNVICWAYFTLSEVFEPSIELELYLQN